jgi:hypothetical protein
MAMGGGILTRAKAREASIEATITRADGRVEHLGVVSYWHRNPFKRWWWHARRWLQGVQHGKAAKR